MADGGLKKKFRWNYRNWSTCPSALLLHSPLVVGIHGLSCTWPFSRRFPVKLLAYTFLCHINAYCLVQYQYVDGRLKLLVVNYIVFLANRYTRISR